jgi:hypothetical protein
MSKVKCSRWEQDVVKLVHNKYNTVGAFSQMGYPLHEKPEFSEVDDRLQQIEDSMAKSSNQRTKRL